jgi:hypothetical protein
MTIRSRALHLVAAVIVATVGAAASAQSTLPAPAPVTPPVVAKPTAKSSWKELTLPQQVALDPLKGEWDNMEPVRRQKWLEIANRYASMKADEQQRVQERMRAWLKLTPEERRVARENYTLSKKIGKDQKTAQWERYQQLPEEEKRKLAADAASKKQITNLPPKTQPKAVAPIKAAVPAACAAGTVKNPNPAGPACIAAPAAVTPAVPAAPTPAPLNPAVPVPNAK